MVGRNRYLQRKKEDKKAIEVADYLGLSESAYTKYERGESKITIDIIQKVAEFYHIDPLSFLALAMPAGSFVDKAIIHLLLFMLLLLLQIEKQTTLMMKLIETQIAKYIICSSIL
jgi:transcriptional regulator with XRE-family HTH domain